MIRERDPEIDFASTCAICGTKDWDAFWMGHATVAVCRRCAIETLPRLIADAAWFPAMRPADAERTLHEVGKEFWRAIAIAIDRARDRDRTPHKAIAPEVP